MLNPTAAISAKATLRAAALARRDALAADVRMSASAAIAARVMAIVADEPPASLAAYLAIRSEVDPRAILDRAAAAGIALALPAVIDATTMIFRRYAPGDLLVPGGFGTLAPAPDRATIEPGLVIVPLIAFDRTGVRLGYGRGFYDRAIARLRAQGLRRTLVGVAFAMQEVASIPVEPHDARLDWIVTESETLDLRPEK